MSNRLLKSAKLFSIIRLRQSINESLIAVCCDSVKRPGGRTNATGTAAGTLFLIITSSATLAGFFACVYLPPWPLFSFSTLLYSSESASLPVNQLSDAPAAAYNAPPGAILESTSSREGTLFARPRAGGSPTKW